MRAIRLLPIALLALLAACASSFPAQVARFQQLPAPTGQTFVIEPRDPAKKGSLEFATYANLVRERLMAQGYQPAANAQAATLVVNLDYGVSNGREKVATRPGLGSRFGYGYFGSPWGYGYPYYAGRRFRSPFFYGSFYDPFWGSAFDYPEVYSYTVYNSFVDMRISRAGTNDSVFEGRAEANTRSDDLTRLVPNLVTAMFTNFPGRSGERVRINVPLDDRRSS
jgi:Domain of unknown function (DUF4136)